MLKLLLIRHGHTAFTMSRRYQGHMDVPLSPEGEQQAERIGVCIRDAFPDWDQAKVYTSDLQRAARTALLAMERSPDVTDARLREMRFGDFEGLTANEIDARFGCTYRVWLERPWEVTAPAGESIHELRARLAAWLDDVQQQQAIVFTHGGVIRTIFDVLRPDLTPVDVPAPCDAVLVELADDRRTLRGLPQWYRYARGWKMTHDS